MIEKPKTVLELLEGHPERLVNDAGNLAENTAGFVVDSLDPNAVRWCLMGAIQFIYGGGWGPQYNHFVRNVVKDDIGGCTTFLTANRDNFPAIIEKIREAGI